MRGGSERRSRSRGRLASGCGQANNPSPAPPPGGGTGPVSASDSLSGFFAAGTPSCDGAAVSGDGAAALTPRLYCAATSPGSVAGARNRPIPDSVPGWKSMYNPAASTAPISGAIRKSHTWLSGCPAVMTAGPKLRAGFTDAPSIGRPAMLTSARVRPITTPDTARLASLRVALSTTSTKTAVRTISIRNAPPAEACRSDKLP